MGRTLRSTTGSSLTSLADDRGLQLLVVATGLVAVAGGIGLQVVWLLLVAAVVAHGLVGSPADDTSPGSGGNGGGGGGPDRPRNPMPVTPVGTANR